MTRSLLEKVNTVIKEFSKIDISIDQLMGNKTSQLFVNFPSNKKNNELDLQLQDKPNTLYIHIPFCTGICSYCAYVTKSAKIGDKKIDDYLEILENEFKLYKNLFGHIKIQTAYIGGGTPTILNIKQLQKLFYIIKNNFDLRSIQEFTLEGCPETMTKDKILFGIENGIDRISIGVESFDNSILKKMNRRHQSHQSIEVIQEVKNNNIPIDIDIIRCYPNYTNEMIMNDLEKIKMSEPDSITTYKYNLKPNSLDSKKIVNFLNLKDAIYQTFLYYEGLKELGYKQHNIDWFVKNDNHKFKHQIFKWEHDANQISMGIGSYGYIGNSQYFNYKSMIDYKNCIYNKKLPIEKIQNLTEKEIRTKIVMFLLRDKVPVEILPNNLKEKINILIDNNFCYIKNNHYELNNTGKFYIDQIQYFMADEKKLNII